MNTHHKNSRSKSKTSTTKRHQTHVRNKKIKKTVQLTSQTGTNRIETMSTQKQSKLVTSETQAKNKRKQKSNLTQNKNKSVRKNNSKTLRDKKRLCQHLDGLRGSWGCLQATPPKKKIIYILICTVLEKETNDTKKKNGNNAPTKNQSKQNSQKLYYEWNSGQARPTSMSDVLRTQLAKK